MGENIPSHNVSLDVIFVNTYFIYYI